MKRKTWPFQFFVLLGTFGLAAMEGCSSKPDHNEAKQGQRFTVIVREEDLYQRPDRQSRKLATLPFGREVTVFEKKRQATAKDWEEIRAGQDLSGFVRSASLGAPEFMEKLRSLMKSVEGMEPQAGGVTTASAFFRLDPGREGQPIEKLPAGTRFEMFERRATLTPQTTDRADGPEDSKSRKEVWYKVRLPDGRVGYIYTKILKFEPPTELSEYTHSRRAVAWLKLRRLKSEDSGGVDEYIVAYATPGVDFGSDYNRVEIYTWDGKRYHTAFAQSSLKGILPIRVIDEGDNIFFELRELDPKQLGQVLVRRYRFPPPIKEVGRSTLEEDVGLH